MASKRCERRKACQGKKRYGTVAEARSVAWRSRVKTSEQIYEYRCPFCNGWHIGHARSGSWHRRNDLTKRKR